MPCSGCPEIKEDWYPEDCRISLINYSEAGVCNFNCCYCTSPAKFSKDVSTEINAQKIVEAFRLSGLLSEDFKMVIGSGEICLHPNRSEIYDLIRERQATVCSNASVCDSRLAELLELGNIELNCSVDAGTRNTFRKVKGYDLFDKFVRISCVTAAPAKSH
jgi:MoaA/NifB/PqqE/SkfB family radical SAM enzyme